jgi:hypothetical protein
MVVWTETELYESVRKWFSFLSRAPIIVSKFGSSALGTCSQAKERPLNTGVLKQELENFHYTTYHLVEAQWLSSVVMK